MKNIIAVTNKTEDMTIFNNFNSAVNSVNEDSKNPMKKELIKTAIEIGCSAYDKEWKEINELILNKDFLVDYLKNLSKKDYEKIIERVGRTTPIKDNVEEVKEDVVEEVKEDVVEEVKEEIVEEVKEEVKEDVVEEVKEDVVEEGKEDVVEEVKEDVVEEKNLNVFNSIFIPNKDKIINCYTNYTNNKFPKEVKYTLFNLYPEDDERLRVLVYHKNDKKKTNPFPTNIFICKNGDLLIDKEIIDIKKSKYVIAESFLNIQKIHLNVKSLFGCGFINPNGYNFVYKNEINNNPENIICRDVKKTKTWKYIGLKK